jgi:transcriptional regulator with XRE-family HTH domain
MEAVRVKASKETGEHLKALRESKGYTQKEAGLKAGFKSGGYIGAFERGEKDLTVNAIKALAAAYEVTENELV